MVHKKGEAEVVSKKEKSAPLMDSQVDRIEQLLTIFNNYFNEYVGFTSIPKGKLPPKFTMPNIKFHGTENSNHYLRNFASSMALKGIDKDIIYPLMFDNNIMRWYNAMDP